MNNKMMIVAILINVLFLAYAFSGPQLPTRVVYLLNTSPTAGQTQIVSAGGVKATCGQKTVVPAGNAAGWSCSGATSTQIVADGYYAPTFFGCSAGFPKDPTDNCQPACGAIPECAGISGQACEEKVQWFAANADQYGCNAKLKVTDPTTGRAVIVRVIDKGPSCQVQSGRGKLDLSQAAYIAINAGSLAQVEKVDATIPLGPVAACN